MSVAKELPTEPKSFRVGCVGGGQLGRMMALEAPRLNIAMSFLDPGGENAPAAAAGGTLIQGNLNDEAKLRELATGCHVVTCEIEHIGTDVLEQMEQEGVNVQPSGKVVRIIQDKLEQKKHFQKHGIPLPPFVNVPSIQAIHDAVSQLGHPLMIKSRRGGYDGRGNAPLNDASKESIEAALTSLGVDVEKAYNGEPLDLYAEGWCQFHCELAVMVVRSVTGETVAYPTVTAIQTDSICRVVLAPARTIPSRTRRRVSLEWNYFMFVVTTGQRNYCSMK